MAPEKEVWTESYEFSTNDENELLKEITDMEANSHWLPGVISNQIRVKALEAPMFVQMVVDEINKDPLITHKVTYPMAYETATEGTKMLLSYGNSAWCVRSTAKGTLHETAKMYGAAFGRMNPCKYADTLNNGLEVARGSTLMLERYGMVSALHSDAAGGYKIMPISSLLHCTLDELKRRFGTPKFKYGMNRHDYTCAAWELPDMQNAFLDVYQQALKNAVSNYHAINFIPAVRFSSSDTASCSAILVPEFKKQNGTYFRLNDGIQVKHCRSVRSGEKDGVDRYVEEIAGLYAMFEETSAVIEKMAQTEIIHPVNCLVGICNKLNIPKKYADAAREEVELITDGNSSSMHDIYLCMAEIIGTARRSGASDRTILNLEEAVAKTLTLDWQLFDVGGVVAWGKQPY